MFILKIGVTFLNGALRLIDTDQKAFSPPVGSNYEATRCAEPNEP
jgi:hypothetical protein